MYHSVESFSLPHVASITGTAVGGVNISGGGIAGILIGVVVGLIVLALVVIIAVWMFRRYKKKTAGNYDFL